MIAPVELDRDEAAFDPLDGPVTIPAQLAVSATRFGDSTYLVGEDGQRLSFTETKTLAEQAARAFLAKGIEPGDRVAIWAPNSIEWIVACLGVQLAGGVLVPLNTRFKGEEAAYILEGSRARILCTVGLFLGNDYAEFLRTARGGAGDNRPVGGLPALERIVRIDDFNDWRGFLAAGESVSAAALSERIAAITPGSTADILFTSGTTGDPKGAVHTHGQALGAVRSYNFVNRTRAGDRIVIVNPFFHSFGYRAGWVAALIEGMTAYPVATLDTAALCALIAREKITVLPGPPALFQSILDDPARATYDLSSLRVGMTGSANMPVDLVRRCYEDLGLNLLLTSYGQTETTAMGTSCRAGDSYETITTTVGRAFPGWTLRIVDAGGSPVESGQPGEIQFKGFNVMQGYFEDPEATARTITHDNWLKTGDVGVLDDRGYLKIVDRLKDIVIVGGFNAYPAEIEKMLGTAPGVAEVAVVAMPDHRLGEVCAAFVVPHPGVTIVEAELIAWARERMANFKVPRRIFTIDALPKTPLGKVQKFILKQQAAFAA